MRICSAAELRANWDASVEADSHVSTACSDRHGPVVELRS